MKILSMVVFALFMTVTAVAQDKSSEQKKATEWVSELGLADGTKKEKVIQLIADHLFAVKDWHNTHPANTVPAGINPLTGQKLSELDRSIIADSAMPDTVHHTLMHGLRQLLTAEEVVFILDKYTIGKVDFTMKGYYAIVPDLTAVEAKTIRGYLEQAREMAIDYKNMKQISAIFEIYKTKSESYLNSNGRNWRQLFSDYVKKAKAEKEKKG